MKSMMENKVQFVATRNACKLCTPLGASLVFRGIEKTVPLLHGSQGCATYIRRYMISHFREPIDISSSNFSEETAIFGGQENLKHALENIISQYSPHVIGIASTCLSETIGDDVPAALKAFQAEHQDVALPQLVYVSTPSYRGTHMDGFYAAILETVKALTDAEIGRHHAINIFPGMFSPEDLRYMKVLFKRLRQEIILLPDYSDTLDGPSWEHYHPIPPGGTRASRIESCGGSQASVEFSSTLEERNSAGAYLQKMFKVPSYRLNWPIGMTHTDDFFNTVKFITHSAIPKSYLQARDRLLDAYADAHKHVFEVKAIVYGEEDLVITMVRFLREFGMVPVLCATGGKSGKFKERIKQMMPESDEYGVQILDNADFKTIEQAAQDLPVDIMIGNSKGFKLSQKLKVPLVRIGFPIHDRMGGQRILHVGYQGAQQLFDRIVNALLEKKQTDSDIGYTYM